MAEEIDIGMKCIKYMLFVANFMFVMIGCLLISIGLTIKSIIGDFELFMASHYFSPSILAIVVGVFIFFVALCGCVGAIKESTCLINLFAFFLTLVLVLEIAVAIAAYAMRSEIESTIREKMSSSIHEYSASPYDRKMWDRTQGVLRCCGIDGPTDWQQYLTTSGSIIGIVPNATTPAAVSTSTVNPMELFQGPTSCCRERDLQVIDNNNNKQCPASNVFQDGCLDVLSYVVSESALLLGCGALAVAFIQMLGIIFACMLAKAVRRLKTQQLMDRDQDRQRNYEQMARGKEENPTPVLYTPTFSEA